MTSYTETQAAPATRTKLSRQQIVGFWAAWSGWTLDGMDSFIYALVLSPALTELLPRSGMAATGANVASTGSIPIRTVPGRLGVFLPVGTGRRPVRPHAHRGRVDLRLRGFHWGRRAGAECLAAGAFPVPGRRRDRRGMGAGGHLCRRKLAGGPAQDGRGLSADRLLRRLLHRRDPELHRRRIFGLARDVHVRSCPGDRRDRHPAARQGTGKMEAPRDRGKTDEPAGGDFQPILPPAHRRQRHPGGGGDRRPVGRRGL